MTESDWFCPHCDMPISRCPIGDTYVMVHQPDTGRVRIHLECLLSGRQMLKRMEEQSRRRDYSEGMA